MRILLNFPIEPTVLREAETMQAFLKETRSNHPADFNTALFFIDNIELLAVFAIVMGIIFLVRPTDTSKLERVKQKQIIRPQPAQTKSAIMARLKKGFVKDSWREIEHGSLLLVFGLVIYFLSTFFKTFVS